MEQRKRRRERESTLLHYRLVTVGVNQPQDVHGAGMSGDPKKTAGKTPGAERENSLREATKVSLTRNEEDVEKSIHYLGESGGTTRGPRAYGAAWRETRKDGRTEVRRRPRLLQPL